MARVSWITSLGGRRPSGWDESIPHALILWEDPSRQLRTLPLEVGAFPCNLSHALNICCQLILKSLLLQSQPNQRIAARVLQAWGPQDEMRVYPCSYLMRGSFTAVAHIVPSKLGLFPTTSPMPWIFVAQLILKSLLLQRQPDREIAASNRGGGRPFNSRPSCDERPQPMPFCSNFAFCRGGKDQSWGSKDIYPVKWDVDPDLDPFCHMCNDSVV